MKKQLHIRRNSLTVKGRVEDLNKFEKDLKKIGFHKSPFSGNPNKRDVCILTYENGTYGYYPTVNLYLPENHCGKFKLPEQHLQALFLLTPTE